MKAKEYLNQIEVIDFRVMTSNHFIEELEEFESDSRERVAFYQSMGVYQIPVVDFSKDKEKYKKQIESCTIQKDGIIKELSGMIGSDLEKSVLYLHYVKGMNLKEIAFYLNSSYDHIRHIHPIALRKFESQYLEGVV